MTRAPVPGPRDTWRTGYYRDGSPVLGVTERSGGTIVDHYETGTPAWREELDDAGRLIRIVDLHPGTEVEVAHRYLDSTGACWLSVHVERGGALGRTQQLQGAVREFPTFRAAQADWVSDLLAHETGYRVFALGAAARDVADLVRHPLSASPSAAPGETSPR